MRTIESVESEIMGYVHELTDSNSVLHKNFYGPDGVTPSDLHYAPGHVHGHSLLVKDETAHAAVQGDGSPATVAAFKRRGALAGALIALDEYSENNQIERFVTASAGNHGLGVVAAANQLGLEATVYGRYDMSPIKIERLESLGGTVVAAFDTLPEALQAAETKAKPDKDGKKRTHFIHPFGDTSVIAGQATVGTEMLESLLTRQLAGSLDLQNDPITVVLPEGGGGLASGIGMVFKQARDNGFIGSNVQVVTARPTDKQNHTWCDGTATTTCELTEAILSNPAYIQGRLSITDSQLAAAMHEASGYIHKAVEPAGALALAGARIISNQTSVRSGPAITFIVPITGANVSKDTLKISQQIRDTEYAARMNVLVNSSSLESDYWNSRHMPGPKSRLNVLGGFIGS